MSRAGAPRAERNARAEPPDAEANPERLEPAELPVPQGEEILPAWRGPPEERGLLSVAEWLDGVEVRTAMQPPARASGDCWASPPSAAPA